MNKGKLIIISAPSGCGKGTVVKNSILLQDTFTGHNVSLNCVITDKNVVIRNNRVLSGHESMPFFISKGAMV